MFSSNDRTRLIVCEDRLYSIREQLAKISKLLNESDTVPREPRTVTELIEEDLKLAVIELSKVLRSEPNLSLYCSSERAQANNTKITAYLKTIETLHKLLYGEQ